MIAYRTFLAGVGEPFTDRGVLVVRAPTSGTLTATVGGVTVQQAVDHTVDDGVVRIEVPGLAPGHRYDWTVTHSGGDAETGTLKTLPTDPDAVIRIGVFGCHVGDRAFWAGRLFEALDCDVVLGLGDLGYTLAGFARSVYGEAYAPDTVNPYDVNLYYAWHRQWWKMPGYYQMRRHIGVITQEDDHRARGDNWDHTVTQANSTDTTWAGVRTPGNPQIDVDDHWNAVSTALKAYYKGNPTYYPYAEKPSSADASTPAANYWCSGFTKDFSALRLVCPDHITSRSPKAATDNASKRMLGPLQEARVIADMTANGPVFRLFGVSKNLFGLQNGDGWHYYSTQRESILTSILGHANGVGVASVTVDLHHPHISGCGSPYYPRDIWEWSMGASDPANQYHVMPSGLADGARPDVYKWKLGGVASPAVPGGLCVGIIEVHGSSHMDFYMYGPGPRPLGGQLLCPPLRLYAGTNVPVPVMGAWRA